MKKSSILTKILLSLVIVALVFALVACGKPAKNKTNNTTDNQTQDEEVNVADKLAGQVVKIIEGVDPLLKVLNGVEASDTLSAGVGLNVEYTVGEKETKGKHALEVKANANDSNPSASISYKNGKTSLETEWVNLTYKDKKLYLKQPVTAVNTDNKVDGTVVDVSALEPAVKDLMAMAMDAIAGLDIKLDFSEISGMVGDLIKQLVDSGMTGIVELLKIEETTNGNKLVLDKSIMDLLGSVLPSILKSTLNDLLGEDLGASVIKFIKDFLAKSPQLAIEVTQKDGAINGLVIDYTEGKNVVKVALDLSLSTKSTVNVSVPEGVKDMSLNIGANAALEQKGVNASVELFATGDLAKDRNNIAYAEVTVNGKKSYGSFNGQTVLFDTTALHAALNDGANKSLITPPQTTNYKVTVKTSEGEGENVTYTANSVVAMLNKAAKDAKADYIKNKGKTPAADDKNKSESTGPKKGISHSIYEFLGGTLTTTTDKDKNVVYADVSEKDMMTKLNEKIGDYVKFTIDTTSDKNNYVNTAKNVVKILAANDTWIVGADYMSESGVNGLTSIGEFVTKFKTWFNTEAKNDGVADGNTKVYGIFDWDTTNYNGGVLLTQPGDNNDILDVVNLFVCQKDKKKIDAKFLADFINYYIAALGYQTHPSLFTADEINAIEAADKTYKTAKETFKKAKKDYSEKTITEAQYKAAKDAYDKAGKAHKTELEKYYNNTAGKADKVLSDILGVQTGAEQLVNNGMYLHIGCAKKGGLNGYIEIRNNRNGATSYAKVGVHLNLVDNTFTTQIQNVVATADNATELYTPEEEAYAARDSLFDDLKEVAKKAMAYQKAA